jgi:hypothetical protein
MKFNLKFKILKKKNALIHNYIEAWPVVLNSPFYFLLCQPFVTNLRSRFLSISGISRM